MDMKSWAFLVKRREIPSVKLTLFFKGLIEGLKTYEGEMAAYIANESRKFARDALFMVFSNLAYRHPDVNLSDGFKRLPAGADVSVAEAKEAPFADKVLFVPRVPED